MVWGTRGAPTHHVSAIDALACAVAMLSVREGTLTPGEAIGSRDRLFIQPRATRGSKKRKPVAVERNAAALNRPIANTLGVASRSLRSRSPLRDDGYAEYRDARS